MEIQYLDSKNLYLYIILHDSSGNALNVSSSGFSSYSDASASNFYIDFPENSSRAGLYNIGLLDVSPGDYTVEIWQHASGGSPDKANDFLRSYEDFTFNGSEFTDTQTPKLQSESHIGDVFLDQTLTFLVNNYDRFNNLSNFTGSGVYNVYSDLTLRDSGSLSSLDTGIYYGQFTVTSGDYTFNSNNNIQIQADTNGLNLGSNLSFSVRSSGIAGSLNSFLEEGYVTGIVTQGLAANNMYTTIEADNDFHNAAIIRFTSGSLAGQARIISDFISTSGEIITNKNFNDTPSINDPFVIFSIGGELNVT